MRARLPGRSERVHRGTTLIEVLAAISVMMIGAVGIAGLNRVGLRMDGEARRITRATAIAEDLAQHIAMWPYSDPRLSNVNTTNDDSIGDPGFDFDQIADVSALVDHGEADLTAGGAWTGIPQSELQRSGQAGLTGTYERYWNVSFNDPANPGAILDYNGNGVADGMRVAVLVRFQTETGWRRVVVHTFKISDQNDR